jgi:WD40 repeat protein
MEVGRPFVGLRPFTSSEANLFFGRDYDIRVIVANLQAARLTLLYGPSGVGKSSILVAGVAEELRRRARRNLSRRGRPELAVTVFSSWRDTPVAGLASAVEHEVKDLVGPLEEAPVDASLTELLAHWSDVVEGPILVVLDQFEEYFLYQDDERGPDGFAAQFADAVTRPDLNANFLVSIREDAYAKLDWFEDEIPQLFENYIRLDHLDVAGARAAIRCPIDEYNRAAQGDVAIEDELVDAILEQVRTKQVAYAYSAAGELDEDDENRIAAPFIQLVLERLWEEEQREGSKRLRRSTLRRLGDASGIVEDHVRRGLATLSGEEQDIAARVFRFLATRSGAKVAHSAEDLADFTGLERTEIEPVLEKLVGSETRILNRLPPPGANESSYYELYHDLLSEVILAWGADRLAAMETRAAEAEAREARRRANRFRAVAAVMVVVAGIAVVLLFLTIAAKHSADNAKRAARSQKLVAESGAALAVDPAAAVRLAERALQTKTTPDAETAFRRAVGLSPLRVVVRHRGEVPRAEYTRDGRRIFTVGAEGTAVISDARTGRRLTTIGYGTPLAAGDISLDGSRAMTAGVDDTVRFWNARTGAQLASFPNSHLISAWLNRVDGREAVATGADGSVRIWRLGSRRPHVAHLTSKPLVHAAFSPDGTRVAISGAEKTAWIVDVRTGHVLHVLRGHLASIGALAWSPESRLLATGDDDYQVHIWDAGTGQSLVSKGWPNPITALAFDAEGKKLAIASGTRIYVVNAQTGRQLAELRGHTDVINHVEFRNGKGEILVSASSDGTARVWDFADYTETTLRTLLGDRSGVDTAVFSPDGRSVLTGSADGTARRWDVATGRELWGHYGWVLDAAFSPDGKWILTGGRDRRLFRWDGPTGKLSGALPDPPTSAVDSIRFSPKGRLVAVAENGGDITIRETTDWAPVQTIQGTVPVAQAVFDPSGRFIARATYDGWTGIFDAQTGDRIRWLSTSTTKIGPDHPLGTTSGVAWSSDGRFIATTSSDARIHIWSPQGVLLHTLLGHAGLIVSPSFAPGSDLLVTAGADHAARVWNAGTGRKVAVLRDDPQALTSAAFSPNGRLVVTGDAGGLTQVWDWRRKQLLATLPMHSDFINAVSFSPDGKRILSASNDSTAKIYACDTCVSLERLRHFVDGREREIQPEAR